MKITDLRSDKFNSRRELDSHISAVLSRSSDPIEDFLIKGTKQQLSDLSLSPTVRVYGVRVEEIEDPHAKAVPRMKRVEPAKSKKKVVEKKKTITKKKIK